LSKDISSDLPATFVAAARGREEEEIRAERGRRAVGSG